MNEKMKNGIKEKTLKALDENDLENVAGGKDLSDGKESGDDGTMWFVLAGVLATVIVVVGLAAALGGHRDDENDQELGNNNLQQPVSNNLQEPVSNNLQGIGNNNI